MMRGSHQPTSHLPKNERKGRNQRLGKDLENKLGGTQKIGLAGGAAQSDLNSKAPYSTFGDSSINFPERRSIFNKSNLNEDVNSLQKTSNQES